MIFKVSKASKWSYNKTIELNSLDELIKYIDKKGPIVINKRNKDEYEITIYDYWLE